MSGSTRVGGCFALASLTLASGGCGQFFDWLSGEDDDAVYGDSRCELDGANVHCSHHSDTLWTGISEVTPRVVHWQIPIGDPPAEGWPVAILFQGSLFSADTFWDADENDGFGGYEQVLVTKELLDSGFAVITPEARLAGSGAWETNIPPMSYNWEESGDHAFMLDIFAAIDSGDFGPCDTTRMFAAGISSGGYMASRMDLAYRSRFRALAIHSASWATCAGPVCELPAQMDPAHLPTVFLHGRLDEVVPVETMIEYHDALREVGVDAVFNIDDGAGHEWIDYSPMLIRGWFERHL